jgi:phage portal protein BeeE
MFGNFYALAERDERGVITAWYPLDARRVSVLVAPDGDVFYQLSADALCGLPDQVTIPRARSCTTAMNTLWHPLVGVSPI